MKASEISDMLKGREEYYSQLHENQKEEVKYYELTYKAGIPEALGYPQRTASTARDYIERGVGSYTLDIPKVNMLPRGKDDADRSKDADVEAFLSFWLKRHRQEVRHAAKLLLLRGEKFLRIDMDDTFFGVNMTGLSKGKFEAQKLRHFPIRLEVPDPINTFASPAHNGAFPVDVIESYEMTMAEAFNLAKRNNWKWKPKDDTAKKVKWVSYIDRESRNFILDEVPIFGDEGQRNIFGFTPYIHISAGYGMMGYEGKPEELYRGILYGLHDVLKLETRILSQIDAMNTRYAYRIPIIEGEHDIVNEFYPGGTINVFNPNTAIRTLKDKVEVSVLEGASPPSGLFEEMAMVMQKVQPPALLSAGKPSGVYSGRLQEDLIGTAKALYEPPFENMEEALALACSLGLKIIENVYKGDVEFRDVSTKGFRTLKPGDIDGHYDCEVQLLAEPPEATDLKKMLGTNLQKAGVISQLYNLMRYHDMTEEQAREQLDRILVEAALHSPGLLEGATRAAMERLGIKQIEEGAESMDKKASKFPPPRNLPAEIPTGAGSIPVEGRAMQGMPTPGELRA
ncbi:MAG TPA: hypothetical protein VMW45_00695 [Dehalococcoidia bacterium]|nr:hypothetical protein [Dehalococcoidia bacterium]